MDTHKHLGTVMAMLCLGLVAVLPASADEAKTKGGLKIESDSGDFSFEFGGRIQADAAFYDEDVAELNDGTEFRRARLFAKGKLFKDWEYKAQYDFAENDLAMKDAYIKYKGLEKGAITIGQFKQPFSLEELTSSKYITFMERALPNAFATGRRLGIGYNTKWNNTTFAVSAYGQEAGNGDDGDEGFGVGARVTFLPYKSDNGLFHLGFAAAIEQPEDDNNESVRFRARPESHVTNTRLVNTGTIDNVDTLTKYGLEAAWVRGPFSLQAEYILADVSRESGSTDVDFDGYYIYASWFLGGNTRPYKDGKFGRVKPTQNGAWELALRFSSIDLNDGLTVLGGEEDNITFGVNYHANSHLRFSANYIMVDSEVFAPVTAQLVEDKPDILQFRAQIDF